MSTIPIEEFYDHEGLTEKLEAVADAAPDLLSLASIGQSREGRELRCAAVANEAAGPPADRRPALLVTANMHAPELAGSWVALHLLRHLVEEYDEDDDVTRLLDERTVYVIPRIAPDGVDAVLEKRTWSIRSRDVEVDAADRIPGSLYAEDVDGDGRVLQMRWRSEDGDECAHPDDDRLLVDRDADDDGPFYHIADEGVVHEYDGGDLVGHEVRSDFNRTFPSETWRPFEWYGQGDYPLEDPETRAVASFVLDHPNVVGVADLHTGNPAIFYPRTLYDPDDDRRADANLLERIGERGEAITDFPYLVSYGEARGDPDPTMLPGSFKDFVYERTGAPAFVVELGMLYNYLGLWTDDLGSREHQLQSERLLMEYHEENPEYGLFHEWEPFDHPQLGEVEIGGWDRPRYSNPPLEEMPDVAERTTEFLLEFAEYAPDVRVRDLTVEPLEDDLYRVSADVVNRGRLPTNLTEQGRDSTQDDRPLASIGGRHVEVVSGRRHRELPHLDAVNGRESLEWVVRGPPGTDVELEVESDRGVSARASAALEP